MQRIRPICKQQNRIKKRAGCPKNLTNLQTILIRSNKMQKYAGIYLLQNHSLHVSAVHRIHHQEYIKL